MKILLLIAAIGILASCKTSGPISTPGKNNNQENFWLELKKLCGKTYKGIVVAAPASDTTFRDKALLMHVRSCENQTVRIPFMVGENRSRTWVFTRSSNHILLKHDHRHEDGSEDSITQYGGWTSNSGTATMQFFPADQHTINILPAAAANVWWVELVPGKYFTYNLRRLGSDRLFSIKFDLTEEVPVPPAPWGF